MTGFALSAFMLVFGIFLKVTKNSSFAQYKKLSWLFIILGIITLVSRIIILYQKGEL